MVKRLFMFLLFALTPAVLVAQSVVSGSAVLAEDGATPLTGFITFRANNCVGRAISLAAVGTTTYTGTTVPVTGGNFTASLQTPNGYCYQVGVYNSATRVVRFISGYGAYQPTGGANNFNTAPTSGAAADTSIPAAQNSAGGTSAGGGAATGTGNYTLTTNGTSGPATLSGGVFNIPVYAGGTTSAQPQALGCAGSTSVSLPSVSAVYRITPTANCTLSFTAPSGNAYYVYNFEVIGTAYTVTYPASSSGVQTWTNGTPPSSPATGQNTPFELKWFGTSPLIGLYY